MCILYHTVGFVSEFLILCKFCKCRRLTDFNFMVTLISWFQLSHCHARHSPMSCNLINLYLFISTLRKWTFLVCCNAWSERPFLTYFIMVTVQHFSNATWTNIIVNVVCSNHTTCCTGFRFRCHCMCRMRLFLKNLAKWLLKGSYIIVICRYCCWVRKLMLHRNWALHTIPATW